MSVANLINVFGYDLAAHAPVKPGGGILPQAPKQHVLQLL
jgi:hypothetical protein